MTDRAGHSATSVILSLVTSAILLATSVVPPQVQAGEGQIIILRKVPSRPATRPGVPAPPLAVKTAPPVDVSPVKEIGQARIWNCNIPFAHVVADRSKAVTITESCSWIKKQNGALKILFLKSALKY